MAVSVHFENEGVPVSMLLDIVEVARSHSGLNLAVAFAKILNDFGISDKVRKNKRPQINDSRTCVDPVDYVRQRNQQRCDD